MTIEYTWKITGLKVKDTDNIKKVTEVSWQKIGTDESGNSATFDGVTDTNFIPPSIDTTFEKVEEITEETVLSWIKEIAVGPYEEHINHTIEEKLGLSAVKEIELPWESSKSKKK